MTGSILAPRGGERHPGEAEFWRALRQKTHCQKKCGDACCGAATAPA